MKPAMQVVAAMSLAISGCASIDGVYSPDCIAFAGDTIELDDGRFSWDRFTDQVLIDDDGNPIDPYPDHPMSGAFSLEQDRLSLVTYLGEPLDDRYLVTHRDRAYLLTARQRDELQNTGQIADCALVKGGRENN